MEKDTLMKTILGGKESEMKTLTSNQDSLVKSALQAGYGITPDTQQNGGALKVESLDPQMKNLTWGADEFTIYKDLTSQGTIKANSTVEKYVTFTKHGRIGHSRFQPEIGISSVNSPEMRQKTVNMKMLVDVKQQSFVMDAVSTIADARRINTEDALVVLGKTIEWAVFYGDADLTSGEKGDGLEFDGLTKLIDPRNVIDMRGMSLTPEVFNKAAIAISKGFGTPTDAYMPVGVKADFGNQFLGAQRIVMPSQDGTTAGVNVDRYLSARGTINLKGSTIMDLDKILDTSIMPEPQAPASPEVTAKTASDKGGKWLEAITQKDSDGNEVVVQPAEVGVEQEYRVVAVGHHGDSLPSEIVKATPAKATDAVELDIKLAAMQSEIPDYVAIYRKGVATGDFYLIGRVAIREMDDTGIIKFFDRDEDIPETADVFVGQMTPNVISLMELIPMSVLNLAIVTTASQFAVLWNGAMALYMPRRWAWIKNVRTNLQTPLSENHMAGINVRGYKNN